MEDPVYLSDEYVLSRMLASETRQEMESYFDNRLQRDFNEDDRRELAKWMCDVCQAEDCQPDIFPLSILIVDRFLSFVRTRRTQLQLLGAVALLLASKLRQTRQIAAQQLVFYTQDLISLRELKEWELLVLTTLKWDLAFITPVDYLDILIRRMKLTDEQVICDIEEEAQRMIIECCLEFRYSLYPPSLIAWACLMRAMETWQLGTDQQHLITSIVAKASTNFTTVAKPMATNLNGATTTTKPMVATNFTSVAKPTTATNFTFRNGLNYFVLAALEATHRRQRPDERESPGEQKQSV